MDNFFTEGKNKDIEALKLDITHTERDYDPHFIAGRTTVGPPRHKDIHAGDGGMAQTTLNQYHRCAK